MSREIKSVFEKCDINGCWRDTIKEIGDDMELENNDDDSLIFEKQMIIDGFGI